MTKFRVSCLSVVCIFLSCIRKRLSRAGLLTTPDHSVVVEVLIWMCKHVLVSVC